MLDSPRGGDPPALRVQQAADVKHENSEATGIESAANRAAAGRKGDRMKPTGIWLLLLSCLLASGITRAQEKVRVVGYLGTSSGLAASASGQAFQRGMTELGWIDGKNLRVEALIVQPLFTNTLGLGPGVSELALKHRLPSISDGSGFADAGGLIYYGPDAAAINSRIAPQANRVIQ